MENKIIILQLNFALSPETSEGEYSNFVVVTHSPAEFVMDFTKILPGVTKARVHSRVVMAPQHTKAFYLLSKTILIATKMSMGKSFLPKEMDLANTL